MDADPARRLRTPGGTDLTVARVCLVLWEKQEACECSKRGATGLTPPSGSLQSLGNFWKRRQSPGKRKGASIPFTSHGSAYQKTPHPPGPSSPPTSSRQPPQNSLAHHVSSHSQLLKGFLLMPPTYALNSTLPCIAL